MRDKKRTAILISGSGSNLQALIEAAQSPTYPAEICLVLSSRKGAKGLERAQKANIPAYAIEPGAFAGEVAYERALLACLAEFEINLICLAGFMRILSPGFVARWRGRILNIHPSLLPAYKGMNTHRRVLAAGETISGCTVHIVTEDLDAGRVLGQSTVSVLKDDTAETLAARILAQEHILYPRILAEYCRTSGIVREAAPSQAQGFNPPPKEA